MLRGRDLSRADAALMAAPGVAGTVFGGVSSLAGMRAVTDRADALSPFDAVIPNLDVGCRESRRMTGSRTSSPSTDWPPSF